MTEEEWWWVRFRMFWSNLGTWYHQEKCEHCSCHMQLQPARSCCYCGEP